MCIRDSINDVMITEQSGILDELYEGAELAADKGFLIERLLNERGMSVAYPPLKRRDQPQFTREECEEGFKQSHLRIHVERMFGDMKTYQCLRRDWPLLMVDLLSDMVNILSLIHISEPTRLLSISYAVFCLKKKNKLQQNYEINQ
eukprot:TRINITY_DN51694_c0_g1_i1.p1 TRINITY_DN51694_c0_g1~~TRINITY_DN51694_c0_g1_i1.p1  ORF type:complete len:146 (-),score=36.70 TRINITY_DN51694_c0_g1_i1:9-446(-)